jgi:beta-glucosidase
LSNLRWLGVDLYRFSVEWSRVQPEAGSFDQEALARYHEWCTQLKASGIAPMVTLHHFTEPLWVTSKGGFENAEVVDDWLAFVAAVAEALGCIVEDWTTLNEPVGYVTQGWIRGEWPPGRSDPATGTRVLEHLLIAHAGAYRIIHQDAVRRGRRVDSCRVGLAHHIVVFRASRRCHPLDLALVRLVDQAYNRAVLDALVSGRLRIRAPGLRHDSSHPELAGTQDFIGVNHYYPMSVGFSPHLRTAVPFVRAGFPDAFEKDDLGCPLDPDSLAEAVRLVAGYALPVLVTEHGVCDCEEPDNRRCRHLRESLSALARVADDADLRGYIHWSLVDNFEWAYGHAPRFGLFRVDRSTLDRAPRQSAHDYRRVIQRHRARKTAATAGKGRPDDHV